MDDPASYADLRLHRLIGTLTALPFSNGGYFLTRAPSGRRRASWHHLTAIASGYGTGNARVIPRSLDLRTMQDYMGHRDPKRTAHYTGVAGRRFEGLWR